MTSYNLILIGYGNMGSALLTAWEDSNLIHEAQILDPAKQLSGIKDKNKVFHVKHFSELDFNDVDMCILAVKPQILESVCADIKPYCDGSFAVLSIAAGKTLSYLETYLNNKTPIIRTMPNTPAMVQKGYTVLIKNSAVKSSHEKCAADLFSACGEIDWISDEKLMDAVTAVSGSGPAYVFYFIEALTKAGIENGLSGEMATKMARQTVIGAASLADKEDNTTPATLRENVTSKGGTTQAGLEVLMDGRFDKVLEETVANAKKRSEDLA